ncbi:hypothetical protein AB0K43_23215 [Kitasatospora sp. NPDC049258]|uniref:hypothetical protein n=1 Tax=Kitasatospora sp. NPDC049258 TaxID=3155394 RepID=UPI003428BB22
MAVGARGSQGLERCELPCPGAESAPDAHDAPGNALHIEVDDGSRAPKSVAWTASCAPDEHGRGSGIVARLATAHGHRRESHGATNWADL